MIQDYSAERGNKGQIKGLSVAVIGLNCIFPGAENLAAYWANIKNGLDSIGDIPADHWSTADYYDPDPKAEDKTYGRRGGFLAPTPFEPLKYGIVPNDLSAIDTTQLLGLVAADRALKDSGYGPENGYDHRRTAVMLGVTGALKMVVSLGSRLAHPQLRRALTASGVDEATIGEVLKRFSAEFTPWQENSFPGLLGNVTAGRIANRLNLGGANLVVDAACASSLAAVRQGLMELASGQADLVVTGGLDTFSDPFMYTCFSKTPALSPTGDVRAYDQDGDGTMLGEGIGVVVLKRLPEAQADGDRIYAVIRAVGSSSDGKGAAIFAPTAEGQFRALTSAYDMAGVSPETVELAEGHGTGTAVGDAVEVEALTRIFSRTGRAAAGRPWCALGSVKSQIGHTKAAAGAAGLIKASLALYLKTLPPTIKVKTPLAVLTEPGSPFHLATRPRPWLSAGPRRAAVSAFGFGGSNFHCVLEEADPAKPRAEGPLDFDLYAASGQNPAEVAAKLTALTPESAGASRRAFSAAAPCRLVLTASAEGLASLAGETAAIISRPGFQAGELPAGVFFGQGPAFSGSYGYLQPGSARIRPGVFRELAVDWPEMLDALNEAARRLGEIAPELTPLDLALYPPDLASAENLKVWADDLGDPRLAEAAVKAVNSGLARILEKFGLKPAAVIAEGRAPLNLVQELGRNSLKGITLWLEAGPGSSLGREAIKALGEGRRLVSFDEGRGDGHPALAAFLGRLAALGLPVDLSAWPEEHPAGSPAAETGAFTVMISGANQFVKKELPPSPPKAAVSAEGRPLVSVLEAMTAETARLHQEFLSRQAEALELMKSELMAAPSGASASRPPVRPVPVPAPAQAAPPVPPAPAPAVWPGGVETVLQVVSQETGYPAEMLNLDMDLEADLGLDSIKKVEIMAVLSERLPAVQGLGAETMNSATSLRDLVALVGGAGGAPVAPSASTAPVVTPAPAPAAEGGLGVWPLLKEVVAAETGYPLGMLEPGMLLADDLGLDSIKLVEIASVMADRLPETQVMAAEVLNEARTLADLAAALEKTAPAAPRPPADPAPAVAAPVPVAPAAERGTSTDLILEVVAQETGYPRDMLGLSMHLEGDLGLDSIKKVEIMAVLSERLPQVEALSTAEVMAGLDTLQDLVALVEEGAPQAAPPIPVSVSAPAPQAAAVPVPVRPPAAPIGELLLDVVAAETGYPRDMLSYSASLEGDLGLDSIKRVEIMAALSERLGDDSLAASAAEVISGAVTLGDLRDLLTGDGPEPSAAPAPSPVPAPAPAPVPVPERTAALDSPAAVAESRRRGPGRPPKNSPPSFKSDAPEEEPLTRTATVTSFRVEMRPLVLGPDDGYFPLAPARSTRIALLAEPSALTARLTEYFESRGRAVEVLGWHEGQRLAELTNLDGLMLIWPEASADMGLPRQAFLALQAAGLALKAAAEQNRKPIVMGLTALGGSLGFGSERPPAPVSGALSGLLKTAAREWPGVRVRVVDLPLPAFGDAAEAYLPGLIAAASAEGVAELGQAEPGRFTAPVLTSYKLKNIRVRHLREGQTLLVTGGARGVTAAALKELARSFRPHLVIMGRTPLTPEEPDWLRGLKDEAAIRQALFDRAEVKPGPRELAKESALLMAGREIKANLAAMEKSGAKVTYVSGNFGEPAALKSALGEIKRLYGPVHGFIHGAGVLADALIMDKKIEDFDLVFDTKARMAATILDELEGQPLNLVAFFSSSTARFGRRGQADYAAGNEILNKLARNLTGSRQAPKCLSVNWGPWEGGMVDGGLKRLFESEGVGLIPLAEGARLFAALVGAPKNDPVEVVVLGPGTELSALN